MMNRVGTIGFVILLIVSQGASGVVIADSPTRAVDGTEDVSPELNPELHSSGSTSSASQSSAAGDLDDDPIKDISEASSGGQTVSISPRGDGEQTFVEGGVYTAIVTVDVDRERFLGVVGPGPVEQPRLHLSLSTPSGDSGVSIVSASSSDYTEDTCAGVNECIISSSDAFSPATTHTVRINFYIDGSASPDSVTLRADPTPDSDDGVAEATYSVTESVEPELAMARAAEARARIAGGYNRTYDSLFKNGDDGWEERSGRALTEAFTIAGNDAIQSAAFGYADQVAESAQSVQYANNLQTVQNARSLYGESTVGQIAEINHELAGDLFDIVDKYKTTTGLNSSYALETLASLSRAEAEAWRAGNRSRARELLLKQLIVLLEANHDRTVGFENEFKDDAPELYPTGPRSAPDLYQQSRHQLYVAQDRENPELIKYFNSLLSYRASQESYIENTALPLTRYPDPHVTLATSQTNVRSRLKNLNQDQSTTVTFTVSNGENAGPTSSQGYLSVSHSEALEITDFREIDGNDAVTSNYSAGGEKINYANKQAPAEYPLTDIREFYDRGETNTYEITIERTSSEGAWLTYRAAFEPLIHNDSEPVEFARYPNDDQIETVDQQNFTAFNLSGQDQKVQDLPPIARISAPSTTVTAGESVTFESSQSSDDRGIAARTWRIPDGKGNTETIDGTSATTAFDSSGRYEVSLTVEDTNGATNTATLNVSVAPKPELTADFEANRTVIQPGDVTKLRATTDADQYAWDLDGDGQFNDGSGRTTTWRPATGGEYPLGLRVSVGNRQDSVSLTYTVESATERLTRPTPVVDMPSTLTVGETGTFDASRSTDRAVVDGELVEGSITSYEWDFDGDGTAESEQPVAEFPYQSAGEYAVRLTLRDNESNTVSVEYTVNVGDEAGEPPVRSAPNCADITYQGSGSNADPYQITNISQLQCVKNQGLRQNYILTSNIDASGTSEWNNGNGFDPIGERYTENIYSGFRGSLDGRGHTITGLTIDRPDENFVGLFGYMSSAKVENIRIIRANITGNNNVGGLAGQKFGSVRNSSVVGRVSGSVFVGGLIGHSSGPIRNSSTNVRIAGDRSVGGVSGVIRSDGQVHNSSSKANITGSNTIGGLVGNSHSGSEIRNSWAETTITAEEDIVGGLVGSTGGLIERSRAFGSIRGTSNVGGLAGVSERGTIRLSYAAVNVTAKSQGSPYGGRDVGGLVGQNWNQATIMTSYATGNVSGSTNVGGLVGSNNYRSSVKRSFAAGNVSGKNSVGGLIGSSDGGSPIPGTVTASYWDTEATGQPSSAGGNNLMTSEMTGDSAWNSMKKLDFINNWSVRPHGYPSLRYQRNRDSLPQAETGTDRSAVVGQQIEFDGRNSTDDGHIVAYAWDIDDDGAYERSGPTPTVSYQSTGIRTVSLRITDDDGNRAIDTVRLNVTTDPSPTVNAGADKIVPEGESVQLSANGSDPTGDSLRYSWSIVEGNGTLYGTGKNRSYRAPSEVSENMTVTIEVTVSGGGQTATDTSDIEVYPTVPAVPIVDADNGTTYDTIQAAVNDATPGDTIRVRPGTYTERVALEKNVTLVAPDGATIDGTGVGSSDQMSAGITISNDSAPVVDGFTIRGFDGASVSTLNAGDWQLRNATVHGVVSARSSAADWAIHDSTFVGSDAGVIAADADGAWTVRNSTFTDGASVSARWTSGNWLVANTTFTDSAGIDARFSGGDWTITESRLSDSRSVAVHAAESSGDWTISRTTIEGSTDSGVNAAGTVGAWEISRTIFRDNDGEGSYGIDARDARTPGDATRNYFGEMNGPSGDGLAGAGDTVRGNLTVRPFYTDPELTTLSNETVIGPTTVNASASTVEPTTTLTNETRQYDVTVVVENVSNDARGEVDVRIDGLTLQDDPDTADTDLTVKYDASDVTNGSLRVSSSVSAVAPSERGVYPVSVTDLRREVGGSVEYLIEDARIRIGQITVTQNDPPAASLRAFRDERPLADGARIPEEQRIELRGGESTDPNDDSLTYSWEQVAGPSARIDPSFGGDRATVVLPDVERNRTLEFELTVSDGRVNDSERVAVTVAPTPERYLDLSKQQPTYVLGAEVRLRGPAPDTRRAALYVQERESAAYRLVELDGQRTFDINGDSLADSSLPSDGVILPGGRAPGNVLLTRYGVHDLAIVAARDAGSPYRPAPALSANEVAEAEKTTTQIRVVPPRLNTTLQTVGGEVAVEDSEFGITGTASGHNVVTVVLVGENGTVRFEQVAVDDVGRVKDDIALFGPRGQFERGPIEVFVLASGRDGEFGDGEFPDARVLEEFLDTLDADSAAAVRAALRNQTVEDDGPTLPGRGQYPFPTDESDDLLETTQFRFTGASTSVDRVAPEDTASTGITPVPNGSAMIVRGTTNLDPDDNTLTVELRASPNNTVRSIQLNRWSSNGTFSAEVDTTGLPAGSYMLFVDDRYESTTVPVTITDEAQSPQGPTASAGANRTVDASATVELDGERSNNPTGDTLQYQWRQVSGPSVSLIDANSTTPTFAAPAVGVSTALAFELTVADGDGNTDTDRVTVTVSPATTDTLLVSPGTDGDYSSIDAAVENASTGATIEVRPGTYRGTVDVSKSITLVAPNGATLDGGVTPDRTLPVAPNRSAAAIEIGDDASPTIEGFTIRNYDAAAIYAFGTTEDWTLRNTTIHDTTIGVGASGSDGAWRLDGVRIRSVTSPVYADDSTGAFAIRDTVLRSNRLALVTTNATADWTLRNTTIRNTNGTAVYAANTTGKWSIHESTIAGNDRGINATGAAPAGNASRNWWGDSSGPGGTFAGTGDAAVGNVTVNPYYVDRALTTTATVPMPSPGPANLTVAPPSLPANITVDTTLSASATITNVGGRNATQPVEFRLDVDQDGTLENTSLERQERVNVSLASGEQRSLHVETPTDGLRPGTYRYGVFTANDSRTGIVNVTQPPSAAATIQFDDATVVNGTRTVTVDRANYTGGQYYVVIHAEQSPGDGSVDLSTAIGNSSELERGAHTDITVDLDPYAASGDDVDALTRDRALVAVVHRTDPGTNTFDGIVTANGTAVADSATVDVRAVSQVTAGPPDSTATFTSIDHAIDSVPDDGTVILRPGTYEQQLTVDRNVTLVAPDGATFDGRNIDEIVTSGISIDDGASPTISGVTVRNYDWGVSASDTTGDWTLRNVTLRNNIVGVQAAEATGSWRIVDSTVRAQSNEGVQARQTTGDWRIERTQIRDTDDAGVDATRAEGNWIIGEAAISDSLGPAIEATRTDGNWLVRTSAIRNNTIGVDATNARGSWTVRTTQVRRNTLDGVVATATTGDWTVTNATVVANYRGVNATRSAGAWTVTDSRLENNTVAVDARGAVTAGSASKNWWGATDGPSGIFRGDGGAVRGNALVRPFYTDAQRTTLSAPIRASVTFENTTVRPGTETLTVDRANYTGQPYVVVLYRDASPDDGRRNVSAPVGVSSTLSTGEHADVPVAIGTTLSPNDTLDRLTANATLVARIHRTGGPSDTYGAAVPRGNATAEVGVELPPATVGAGTATAISNTTVSVPIRARNATNVVTVGANVSYDPTLANVTSVSGSDAEDSTVTVDNENGTLRFEYRYAERETPTVNVTFDAGTATGASTPITVANATVETAGPREPSVRTADGRLTVLGSTVTVTNSTLNATTVRPDDTVVVTATVTNAAPVVGTFGVPLRVNGSQERVRNVSLGANETTTVRFRYTPTDPGTTAISVGTGAPRTLTVDAITVDETRTTTTVGGRTAPGTPLNASLTGTNGTTDAAVSLDRVTVSTTREANVSLEVNVSADSSGAPPLGDAAAYLNVSESVPEDAIGTVTFGFTVDTDRLSNPESAELYRYHDGTWNALETTYLGERNGAYRFETVSPGLSVFAVRQSASGVDTGGGGGLETDGESASTPAATAAPTTPSTPGQSTAAPSTATPPSTSEDIDPSDTTPSAETRTADSSESVQTRQPNPTAVEPGGFGAPIFVVVLVLLGGSLAAVAILRRRDRL